MNHNHDRFDEIVTILKNESNINYDDKPDIFDPKCDTLNGMVIKNQLRSDCDGCKQRYLFRINTPHDRFNDIVNILKNESNVNYDDKPDIFDPKCDTLNEMSAKYQSILCNKCKK